MTRSTTKAPFAFGDYAPQSLFASMRAPRDKGSIMTTEPTECPHCGDDLRRQPGGDGPEWSCAGCAMTFELAANGHVLLAKGGFPPPTNLHTLLTNHDLERHRGTLQAMLGHTLLTNDYKDEEDAVRFALAFMLSAVNERERNRETIKLLRFKLQTAQNLARIIVDRGNP